MKATNASGHELLTYDDVGEPGGSLWAVHTQLGNFSYVYGVIRALTWEDAYEIAQSEIFPEAHETHEQLVEEFGEDYDECAIFQESYGFRPSGPNERDVHRHRVYQTDPGGDPIAKLREEDNITITESL